VARLDLRDCRPIQSNTPVGDATCGHHGQATTAEMSSYGPEAQAQFEGEQLRAITKPLSRKRHCEKKFS